MDGLAVSGDARNHREVDVMIHSIEVHEELINLVENFFRSGITAVHLVHHNNHREVLVQRLGEHVTSLGQRTLGGVHQQQHAVDDVQTSLDLTTKVGVARSVHDVQFVRFTGRRRPADRRLLGENGDAPLALLVI